MNSPRTTLPVVGIRGADLRLLEMCRESVEDLLQRIPSRYLTGLKQVLILEMGQASKETQLAAKSRPASTMFGSYFPSSSAPWIELYIDKIAERYGRRLLEDAYTRERTIAVFLFHEVGHHVVKRIRPESGNAEKLANDWADKLLIEAFSEDGLLPPGFKGRR